MEKSLNCKCGEKIRNIDIDELFNAIKNDKLLEEKCPKCKKRYAIKIKVNFEYAIFE